MYCKLPNPIFVGAILLIFAFAVHSSFAVHDVSNGVNFSNVTKATAGIYGIPLSKSNLIGIQLSLSCIKLEQNKIHSHCLTYDKLKYLDNTDPRWSGTWVNDTWYHRLMPKISNSYTANANPFVVLVDPDPVYSARAKMIIVQTDNFTWINPDDNGTNTKLITHVNRFVTAPCLSANVAPIVSLVEDTVKYFESGCTKTSFNDAKMIYRTETPFDFIHCTQCHYEAWKVQAKLVKQNCITNVCTPLHDPHENSLFYTLPLVHNQTNRK